MWTNESYHIHPFSPTEEAAWDQTLSGLPTGTIFHSSKWLSLHQDVFGDNYRLWGCCRNDQLLATAPVYERRRYGLTVIAPPIITPYNGPVYLETKIEKAGKTILQNAAIQEAMAEFLQRKYDAVQFCHQPGVLDVRGFQWQGWRTDVRYTFVLDFNKVPDLNAHLVTQIRRSIRKAEDTGVRVITNDAIDECYRLFVRLHQVQQLPLTFSKAQFGRFMGRILADNMGQVMLGIAPDGQPCAFDVVVWDANQGYLLISASEPALRGNGAVAYVRYQILESLRTKVRKVDLVGANIKAVANFKAGWGAELVPTYMAEIKSTQRAKWAYRLYPLLKALG